MGRGNAGADDRHPDTRKGNGKTRETLYKIIAEHSGKPYEEIFKDAERDNYMNATEAREYGLIDHIFSKRHNIPKPDKS